ncbi:hypothetical protein KGQ71_01855 [Patescibacteria group bacterium]|nr:hypothetical protein [Patescibacteria group bacterium]
MREVNEFHPPNQEESLINDYFQIYYRKTPDQYTVLACSEPLGKRDTGAVWQELENHYLLELRTTPGQFAFSTRPITFR